MKLTEQLIGRRCDCRLCKRGRMFDRITKKLPAKDRQWMHGLYNYLFEMEAELKEKASKSN